MGSVCTKLQGIPNFKSLSFFVSSGGETQADKEKHKQIKKYARKM